MIKPLKNPPSLSPRGSLQFICNSIKLPGAQAVFLKCDPYHSSFRINMLILNLTQNLLNENLWQVGLRSCTFNKLPDGSYAQKV